MHKHVFSVAMILFVAGSTFVPAPPPSAIVSRLHDVLAAPFPALPDAMPARAVTPTE